MRIAERRADPERVEQPRRKDRKQRQRECGAAVQPQMRAGDAPFVAEARVDVSVRADQHPERRAPHRQQPRRRGCAERPHHQLPTAGEEPVVRERRRLERTQQEEGRDSEQRRGDHVLHRPIPAPEKAEGEAGKQEPEPFRPKRYGGHGVARQRRRRTEPERQRVLHRRTDQKQHQRSERDERSARARPGRAALVRARARPPADVQLFSSGLSRGKRTTSRMLGESVKSIASRSMPTPSPAVGGIPCSNART